MKYGGESVNNENLKNGKKFRSGEEATRKAARNGGIASGVSRNLMGAMKRYFKEHPEELDNIVKAAVKGFKKTYDARLLSAIVDLNGESVQRELAKLKRKELKLKEQTASGTSDIPADDGFIEALNSSAAGDWSGEDD